jgi:hypothetical protein
MISVPKSSRPKGRGKGQAQAQDVPPQYLLMAAAQMHSMGRLTSDKDQADGASPSTLGS